MIALLVALNDTFVLSMKVFLKSLLETNPWFNYDILLLSDGNLSEGNITDLRKIYNNIKIIQAKKADYASCMPTTETWGYNLFYRFDVFDMGDLGYDRIIIFDSDMVFLKDIKELFGYQQDFAACKKHLGISEINIDDPDEINKIRFNCGLMSISRKYLRPFFKFKLINLASRKSWSSDQPVFNVCFQEQVYYLPQKFNIVSSIITKENLAEACILQYHGFTKPWHSEVHGECFGEFIKEELAKFNENVPQATETLKNIFNDYVKKLEIQ
jgi:lipopolysaccharide biosynthesis glycosyltransferase